MFPLFVNAHYGRRCTPPLRGICDERLRRGGSGGGAWALRFRRSAPGYFCGSLSGSVCEVELVDAENVFELICGDHP
jgi:hypothetical protein